MYRFYVTVYGKATLIRDMEMQTVNAYIRFRIFNADYYCSKKNIKSRFKLKDIYNHQSYLPITRSIMIHINTPCDGPHLI